MTDEEVSSIVEVHCEASLEVAGPSDTAMLMTAAAEGHMDRVEQLLKRGADPFHQVTSSSFTEKGMFNLIAMQLSKQRLCADHSRE